MKSMIIGAAGFVGPYLAEAILASDSEAQVVCTKLPFEKVEIPGCRIIDLNILEPEELLSVLNSEKPDYIYHLAAQSSVAVSWKKPQLTVDINIKGALNLLETLRQLDFKPRTLIVGTGEEYGHVRPQDIPLREDTRLDPGNVYAVTKATQNMLASLYSKAYGIDVMMTRSFNHIGPKQTPVFVVADFASQVVKIEKGLQEPVIRVGNLSAMRDFTDVRDVVKGYVMLCASGKSGETYNVGRGKAVKIEDILKLILSKSAADIRVEVDPDKLRPVDVPIIEPDISKITADTGWIPEISLEQTIDETLSYWRENITV